MSFEIRVQPGIEYIHVFVFSSIDNRSIFHDSFANSVNYTFTMPKGCIGKSAVKLDQKFWVLELQYSLKYTEPKERLEQEINDWLASLGLRSF